MNGAAGRATALKQPSPEACSPRASSTRMRSAVSAAALEWVMRMPAPAFALICVAQQRERLRGACAGRDFRSARRRAPAAADAPARARSQCAGPRRRTARADSGAQAMRCPTAPSISPCAAPRSCSGDAQQIEGQRDVLRDGQVGQHVEGLKHEADGPAAQQRARVVVQRDRSTPSSQTRPVVRLDRGRRAD